MIKYLLNLSSLPKRNPEIACLINYNQCHYSNGINMKQANTNVGLF